MEINLLYYETQYLLYLYYTYSLFVCHIYSFLKVRMTVSCKLIAKLLIDKNDKLTTIRMFARIYGVGGTGHSPLLLEIIYTTCTQ